MDKVSSPEAISPEKRIPVLSPAVGFIDVGRQRDHWPALRRAISEFLFLRVADTAIMTQPETTLALEGDERDFSSQNLQIILWGFSNKVE
jgi:hypothetical protein